MAGENIVNAHVQNRRGTAAQWNQLNPVLAGGEVGYITDTKLIKIGDGVTAWNSLPDFHVVTADKLKGVDSAEAATPSTVAVRDNAGALLVGAPTVAQHAVTKTYVDTFLAPPSTKIEVFTASGTWTKDPKAKAVQVVCIGGGGSGGNSGTASYSYPGSGGGGGARVEAVLGAAALPATVPVVVGASVQGGNGGSSTFSTYLGANGGSVGTSINGSSYPATGVVGGVPFGVGVSASFATGPLTSEGQGGFGSTANNSGTITSYGHGGSVPWGGGGGCGTPSFSGGASGALPGGPSSAPGTSRSGSGLAGTGGGPGINAGDGYAGGIPGGGGGGGNQNTAATNLKLGGVGGRGEVVVISYF